MLVWGVFCDHGSPESANSLEMVNDWISAKSSNADYEDGRTLTGALVKERGRARRFRLFRTQVARVNGRRDATGCVRQMYYPLCGWYVGMAHAMCTLCYT